MISIIIPTLNAEAGLGRTLASLVPAAIDGLVREVIVVDGGSEDRTRDIAEDAGASIIDSASGRGPQLATGANAARSDWFLFLHADTVLSGNWQADVTAMMSTRPHQAGAFRFALNDDSARARVMENFVRLRCAAFALPYGDQGLLISRKLYEEIGGYGDMPLMEDVDIIRRIGRRRLTMMASPAITSAARYQKYGYIIRSVRNFVCVTLYFSGVKPQTIRKLYG